MFFSIEADCEFRSTDVHFPLNTSHYIRSRCQDFIFLLEVYLPLIVSIIQLYISYNTMHITFHVSSCGIRNLFPAYSLQTPLLRRSVFQSRDGERYSYLALGPMKNHPYLPGKEGRSEVFKAQFSYNANRRARIDNRPNPIICSGNYL